MYVNNSICEARREIHALKRRGNSSHGTFLVTDRDVIYGLRISAERVHGGHEALCARLQDVVEDLEIALLRKRLRCRELLRGKTRALDIIDEPVWMPLAAGVKQARKDLSQSAGSFPCLSSNENDGIQYAASDAVDRKEEKASLGEKFDVAVSTDLPRETVQDDSIAPRPVITHDERALPRDKGIARDDERDTAVALEMGHKDGEPDAQNGAAHLDQGAGVAADGRPDDHDNHCDAIDEDRRGDRDDQREGQGPHGRDNIQQRR